MGGVVSASVSNDEMVDKLKSADYIRTPIVEKVFRAIDRGDYFTKDSWLQAYLDMAWRKGNIHISAPCIYAKVLEGLDCKPGMTFLNLGSGTGYLSTMIGLILGPHGVNHGVELQADVIDYAVHILESFKSTSSALDAFSFCEPQFVQGNCLCLPSDMPLYDRVYCGATCDDSYESYMRRLIKVGGIMVMPLNEQLLKITRTGQESWETTSLLPVSFSPLVTPDPHHPPPVVTLPPVNLPMLQELCRHEIRDILRHNIEIEHPELPNIAIRPVAKPKPAPQLSSQGHNIQSLFSHISHITCRDSDNEDSDDDNLSDTGDDHDTLQAPSQVSLIELTHNFTSSRNSTQNANGDTKPETANEANEGKKKEKAEEKDSSDDDWGAEAYDVAKEGSGNCEYKPRKLKSFMCRAQPSQRPTKASESISGSSGSSPQELPKASDSRVSGNDSVKCKNQNGQSHCPDNFKSKNDRSNQPTTSRLDKDASSKHKNNSSSAAKDMETDNGESQQEHLEVNVIRGIKARLLSNILTFTTQNSSRFGFGTSASSSTSTSNTTGAGQEPNSSSSQSEKNNTKDDSALSASPEGAVSKSGKNCSGSPNNANKAEKTENAKEANKGTSDGSHQKLPTVLKVVTNNEVHGASSSEEDGDDHSSMEIDSDSHSPSSGWVKNEIPMLDPDDLDCPCGESCSMDSEEKRREKQREERPENVNVSYTKHMREKINRLPLPHAVKQYVNYHRPL